jgi:hypothetical protein
MLAFLSIFLKYRLALNSYKFLYEVRAENKIRSLPLRFSIYFALFNFRQAD